MKAEHADMTWDLCVPGYGRPRSGEHVTINLENGTMFIAVDTMLLAGNPEAVRVLYSAEHATIGLRPSTHADTHAAHVAQNRRTVGVSGMVSVRDLAQKIRAKRITGSFRVPMERHPDGTLFGELSRREVVVRAPRRAKGGGA